MTAADVDRRLSPAAREALQFGDDAARLRVIRRKPFVRHASVNAILERLEEALEEYPTEGDTHILIYGLSGIGKSKATELFAAQHCKPDDPQAPVANVPVLHVSMGGTKSGRGLLMAILHKLGAPYGASASVEWLYPTVVKLLKHVGVKMLIIDEIHHVAFGNRNERIQALSVIKGLGNDLKITVVGCGIPDALRALKWDPQLERRFEPIRMPLWGRTAETYGFLNSLESVLPLRKASNLSQDPVADWIIDQSEGLTREIVHLVRKAAVQAIRTGRERIDVPLLKTLHYTSPSARRLEVDKVLRSDKTGIAQGW